MRAKHAKNKCIVCLEACVSVAGIKNASCYCVCHSLRHVVSLETIRRHLLSETFAFGRISFRFPLLTEIFAFGNFAVRGLGVRWCVRCMGLASGDFGVRGLCSTHELFNGLGVHMAYDLNAVEQAEVAMPAASGSVASSSQNAASFQAVLIFWLF